MSFLLEAAGLGAHETLRAPELEALYREAECFLDAGGAVSGAEWVGLALVEREALAAAGRARQKRQAVDAGLAAQGLREAATILAAVDGGAALDAARAGDRRAKLQAAVERAGERLSRRTAAVEVVA